MSLRLWAENSWIRAVKPTATEVRNMLAIADRNIADAGLEGISPEGRFDHAYDAVRSLCEAALSASGYTVPKGQRKHERLIASLGFTVGGEATGKVDYLDRCRRLRHKTLYERADVIQQPEADRLLDAAKWLRAVVRTWLRQKHSDLSG